MEQYRGEKKTIQLNNLYSHCSRSTNIDQLNRMYSWQTLAVSMSQQGTECNCLIQTQSTFQLGKHYNSHCQRESKCRARKHSIGPERSKFLQSTRPSHIKFG